MKKSILLNSQISAAIAKMGHTDTIAIGDCGLPIRGGAERIDLALKMGVPDFMTTLKTVLSELCVEKAVLAQEIVTASPEIHKEILKVLGTDVAVEYIPHENFKTETESCVAVVRTGECTSYANIILCSGVTF